MERRWDLCRTTGGRLHEHLRGQVAHGVDLGSVVGLVIELERVAGVAAEVARACSAAQDHLLDWVPLPRKNLQGVFSWQTTGARYVQNGEPACTQST